MGRVRGSGASGATITAWFAAMAVLVGDDEETGALPELEELLSGTSEFIGTLGEEAKHLETMLLVIVMALLVELLHLLWASIFNPIGAAVAWAALLVAGRNLVIAAVVGFVQRMFNVLRPFIVAQAVSILFQVGVEFFTQLLNGRWDLDRLGKAAAAGAAAGLPMPLVSMALGTLIPRLQRMAGERGAGAVTVRELGAGGHRGGPGGGRLGHRLGDHQSRPQGRCLRRGRLVGVVRARCAPSRRHPHRAPRRTGQPSPTRAGWRT